MPKLFSETSEPSKITGFFFIRVVLKENKLCSFWCTIMLCHLPLSPHPAGPGYLGIAARAACQPQSAKLTAQSFHTNRKPCLVHLIPKGWQKAGGNAECKWSLQRAVATSPLYHVSCVWWSKREETRTSAANCWGLLERFRALWDSLEESSEAVRQQDVCWAIQDSAAAVATAALAALVLTAATVTAGPGLEAFIFWLCARIFLENESRKKELVHFNSLYLLQSWI